MLIGSLVSSSNLGDLSPDLCYGLHVAGCSLLKFRLGNLREHVLNKMRSYNNKMRGYSKGRLFSTLVKQNVGFLGCGNMGYYMIKHILSHGHTVTAYDVQKNLMDEAVALVIVIFKF